MEATFPWFFLLHILFVTVQLCEVPRRDSHHIRSLNEELLTLTEDTSKDPNPSIYLALRLSSHHNLEKESQYFERLKNISMTNSRPAESGYQRSPGTGQLALYLLALRAACSDMKQFKHENPITQLKRHLTKERKQIGHDNTGRPITNYYQYSLGVLALCVHGKKVEESVIHKLLHARQHKRFRHDRTVSVDTEAMAGLAFVCLSRAPFYCSELLKEIGQAAQDARTTILQAQTPAGALGNIYSTPLAVQFLIASGLNRNDAACPKVMDVLLQSLKAGKFRNAHIKSQLLPALQGKSYLDADKKDCQAETGFASSLTEGLDIRASTHSSKVSIPRAETINVSLTVKASPEDDPLYVHSVTVLPGSSLLDVLKTAEKDIEKPLSFKTHKTLSGPMLIEVMGLKAQKGEHKYWKVSRGRDVALEQGIADYVPEDEESILLELVQW